jgi:hypothetical protein
MEKATDGAVWRCLVKSCRRYRTVKTGLFENFPRLTIREILLFITDHFVNNRTLQKSADALKISRETLTRVRMRLRELLVEHYKYVNRNRVFGLDPDSIVEIDELLLYGRRKSGVVSFLRCGSLALSRGARTR